MPVLGRRVPVHCFIHGRRCCKRWRLIRKPSETSLQSWAVKCPGRCSSARSIGKSKHVKCSHTVKATRQLSRKRRKSSLRFEKQCQRRTNTTILTWLVFWLQCRQEYKNAYLSYLSSPTTETLSAYFNSHNAYVQQLHATNGMLDEYGRETLPTLLQVKTNKRTMIHEMGSPGIEWGILCESNPIMTMFETKTIILLYNTGVRGWAC